MREINTAMKSITFRGKQILPSPNSSMAEMVPWLITDRWFTLFKLSIGSNHYWFIFVIIITSWTFQTCFIFQFNKYVRFEFYLINPFCFICNFSQFVLALTGNWSCLDPPLSRKESDIGVFHSWYQTSSWSHLNSSSVLAKELTFLSSPLPLLLSRKGINLLVWLLSQIGTEDWMFALLHSNYTILTRWKRANMRRRVRCKRAWADLVLQNEIERCEKKNGSKKERDGEVKRDREKERAKEGVREGRGRDKKRVSQRGSSERRDREGL